MQPIKENSFWFSLCWWPHMMMMTILHSWFLLYFHLIKEKHFPINKVQLRTMNLPYGYFSSPTGTVLWNPLLFRQKVMVDLCKAIGDFNRQKHIIEFFLSIDDLHNFCQCHWQPFALLLLAIVLVRHTSQFAALFEKWLNLCATSPLPFYHYHMPFCQPFCPIFIVNHNVTFINNFGL